MNNIINVLGAKTVTDLINQLIDDRCEQYGVGNTIAYLKDFGMQDAELVAIGFDVEDVSRVE